MNQGTAVSRQATGFAHHLVARKLVVAVSGVVMPSYEPSISTCPRVMMPPWSSSLWEPWLWVSIPAPLRAHSMCLACARLGSASPSPLATTTPQIGGVPIALYMFPTTGMYMVDITGGRGQQHVYM